jgi:DNA gyrase subunit A
MVALREVVDTDDLMIITAKGVLIRLPVATLRTISRNTQGVRLIKLDEGDTISAVTRVVESEDKNNGNGELEESDEITLLENDASDEVAETDEPE